VGKNYSDHVKEMGGDVQRSKPVFFTKTSNGVVLASGSLHDTDMPTTTPTPIRYPPNTNNLHYECELVVAIGKGNVQEKSTNGDTPQHVTIPVDEAADYIYGFALGIDLTRRDLQQEAKGRRGPWDTAKQFDHCAPMGPIHQMSLSELQEMESSLHMELQLNGTIRQSTKPLQEMIWSIPEIIVELSRYCALQSGDLIMTGTPAGVGSVERGDRILGRLFEKTGNGAEKNVLASLNMTFI
jgi:fumarylpyruvate hydrolase